MAFVCGVCRLLHARKEIVMVVQGRSVYFECRNFQVVAYSFNSIQTGLFWSFKTP